MVSKGVFDIRGKGLTIADGSEQFRLVSPEERLPLPRGPFGHGAAGCAAARRSGGGRQRAETGLAAVSVAALQGRGLRKSYRSLVWIRGKVWHGKV